jgi:hypothetical protein
MESSEDLLMTNRRTEMTHWTKSVIVTAVIAATGLAGMGVALARGDGCEYAGRKHDRAEWSVQSERMRERIESRMSDMESSLALRDEQRDAWNALEQTMRNQMEAAGERMAKLRESKKPATAIERMQRMEEMSSARMQSMGEVRKAVEALYSQLDATQQKTFDEKFRMGMQGRGKHQRGGMMGPGGMS